MPQDLLAAGAAWLAGQLKANGSQTVVYRSGAHSVSLQATFDSQLLRIADGQANTRVERADADWILTAADLNFGSGAVVPVDGDTIQATFGGETKTFKVMKVGGVEPSWRYCDPFQTMLRIHTKYVSG